MKNFWMFSPAGLLAAAFTFSPGDRTDQYLEAGAPPVQIASDSFIVYTAKIKAIIDAKCYDCHSAKGKDEEAREELMWDDLPKLSKMDQLYSMDAIIESIEDGEMPPEDHIKKHPGAALTKEEARLLIEWADAIASKLLE